MNFNDSLDIENSTEDDYNFDAPKSGNLLELNVDDCGWFNKLNESIKGTLGSSDESSASSSFSSTEENKENVPIPVNVYKQLPLPEGNKNEEKTIQVSPTTFPAISKLTIGECHKNRIDTTAKQQPSASLLSIKQDQATTGKQIKRTFGMPPPPTAVKPYQTLNRLMMTTAKPSVTSRMLQTLPRVISTKQLTVPVAPSFMTGNRNQAKESHLRIAALENKKFAAQKTIKGSVGIAQCTSKVAGKKPISAPPSYPKCRTATPVKPHLTVPKGPTLMTEARKNAKESHLRIAALENKKFAAQKTIKGSVGIAQCTSKVAEPNSRLNLYRTAGAGAAGPNRCK